MKCVDFAQHFRYSLEMTSAMQGEVAHCHSAFEGVVSLHSLCSSPSSQITCTQLMVTGMYEFQQEEARMAGLW